MGSGLKLIGLTLVLLVGVAISQLGGNTTQTAPTVLRGSQDGGVVQIKPASSRSGSPDARFVTHAPKDEPSGFSKFLAAIGFGGVDDTPEGAADFSNLNELKTSQGQGTATIQPAPGQ